MGRVSEHSELEERFKQFDWDKTFYDPMDVFNFELPEDQYLFAELESLIDEVRGMVAAGPAFAEYARELCEKHWRDTPMEVQIPSITQHMDLQQSLIVRFTEQHFREFDWKRTASMSPAEWEKEFTRDIRYKKLLVGLKDSIAQGGTEALAIQALCETYWKDHPIKKMVDMNNEKISVMNEQNFEYLKDSIKFLGFGEQLGEELKKGMSQGAESFTLPFKASYEQKEFEASLQFKKSATSEMYFLNGFDAKLKDEVGLRQHAFRLNKGKGVTMKEAYNLLEGRAVYKELTNRQNENYRAWIKLDLEGEKKEGRYQLKQYHDNYGFDIEKTLKQYPQIKETLTSEGFDKLVQSLKKGNEQSVGLVIGDETRSIKISADPEKRSIASSDEGFSALKQETKQTQSQEVKQNLSQKQSHSISREENSINKEQKSFKQSRGKGEKQRNG